LSQCIKTKEEQPITKVVKMLHTARIQLVARTKTTIEEVVAKLHPIILIMQIRGVQKVVQEKARKQPSSSSSSSLTI